MRDKPEKLDVLVDDDVVGEQAAIAAHELLQRVHRVLQVLRLLDDLLDLDVRLLVVAVPRLRLARVRHRPLPVRKHHHADVGRLELVVARWVVVEEGRRRVGGDDRRKRRRDRTVGDQARVDLLPGVDDVGTVGERGTSHDGGGSSAAG